MATVQKVQIDNIFAEAHKRMLPTLERRPSDKFVTENRLVGFLSRFPSADLPKLRQLFQSEYRQTLSVDDVVEVLKAMALFHDREPLFKWVRSMVELIVKALSGNEEAFREFANRRNEILDKKLGKRRNQERILIISIYSHLTQFDKFGDLKLLMMNGNPDGVICLNEFLSAIASAHAFTSGTKRGHRHDKPKKSQKENSMSMEQALSKISQLEISFEQALDKVDLLESEGERTKAMLKDLQDEFDEQIAEEKVHALNDFFSKLNSDVYGRILDSAFSLKKGILALRKEQYDVPEAINGIMIMTMNFLKFIKENHINPILKPNDIKEVSIKDVENYEYDGTPFKSETETKLVRVISPGWIYQDKKIQISPPKVKEEA